MTVDARIIMTAALNGLGIRSASDATDLSGASYAFDDGLGGMAACRQDAGSWEAHLDDTIDTILAHENHAGRHLLLVRGVRGTGERYGNSFTKCSSRGRSVAAAVLIGEQSRDTLKAWVIQQIPFA